MTLKLKRTPGLYLVGFMASGKSTVASKLAEELGWCFVDLDKEIEQAYGKTISQIFLDDGESAFREIETRALQEHVTEIEAGKPCVVALGGGAFVQLRNWELIENNGITIWLDCPFETVLRRLGDDTTRPLAANRTKLSEIFEDRRPLYARADFRIAVDTDDVSQIVRQILELPIF
jgi:shikimate kinase